MNAHAAHLRAEAEKPRRGYPPAADAEERCCGRPGGGTPPGLLRHSSRFYIQGGVGGLQLELSRSSFSAKNIKAKRVFIKENGPFHQDRPHLYKSPAARAAGKCFDI